MGFDSGTLSFRIFHLRQRFTRDDLERFAAFVAPPLDTLGREAIQGWVSGRHLLDRDLQEENCIYGSWMHLALLRAERKIPEALLRAYCRLEEENEKKARQVAFLTRKVRMEIKDRVREALLPTMPPTLNGIPILLDFRNDRLFAGAMSDQQIDRFSPFFRDTTGCMPVLVTAETLALQRKQINANDLTPSSFTPDESIELDHSINLGLEFMTWLWYRWERDGGTFTVPSERLPFGYMLEGPITFYREGEGAHEALLRKGEPLLSREAGTALYCGKKLKRAKMTIAQGEQQWLFTLDADFSFRGMKLPECQQLDYASRLQERAMMIEKLLDAFTVLYDGYLEERKSVKKWQVVTQEICAWVENRHARD